MPMILWDERKRVVNLEKHRLDFAALSDEFFDEAVIVRGKLNRWAAINRIGARTITAIFARYGVEGISVMSMRPSSHTERQVYEQEKAKRV
jgi:hypothetical protein